LNPRHTYTDNGRYRVILSVSDEVNTVADTTEAVISNVSPSATFVAPAGVTEGSSFQLSLTGAKDAVGDLSSLHYAFDCGAGYGTFGTASSISCSAGDDGMRTVKGTIRDKDGDAREYTGTVSVANVAPSVSAGSDLTLARAQAWTLFGDLRGPGPGHLGVH
jgi:PKD repeat protein